MRISPPLVAGCLIVGSLFSVASPANAGTVTLDTLLVCASSFTSGDKAFSNFVYRGRTNDMLLAASVSITDIAIWGDFGIRIQGTFQDLPGAGNSTVTLQYTVTATAPGDTIVGAGMSGDPVLVGGGQFVTVKEVFAQNASDLNVFADIESSTQSSDSESFLSQPFLNVATTFTARDGYGFGDGDFHRTNLHAGSGSRTWIVGPAGGWRTGCGVLFWAASPQNRHAVGVSHSHGERLA